MSVFQATTFMQQLQITFIPPITDNGKYVLAINYSSTDTSGRGVYLSTDSGATFNIISTTSGVTYNDVSMSQSGQYMTIVGPGKIIRSTDYGSTWSNVSYTSPGQPLSAVTFTSVYVSKSGQYQVAGLDAYGQSLSYGVVWVSNNYGATYINATDGSNFAQDIEAVATTDYPGDNYYYPYDGTGGVPYVGAIYQGGIGVLYGWSYDYGTGFYKDGPTGPWYGLDNDSSAEYWGLVSTSTGSTTSGIWVAKKSDGHGASGGYIFAQKSTSVLTLPKISISSTGDIQFVSSNNSYIYYSTDYGNNWSTLTSFGTKYYNDISVSQNGQTIYTAVSTNSTKDYIYKSIDTGSNWVTSSSLGYWKRICTNK